MMLEIQGVWERQREPPTKKDKGAVGRGYPCGIGKGLGREGEWFKKGKDGSKGG